MKAALIQYAKYKYINTQKTQSSELLMTEYFRESRGSIFTCISVNVLIHSGGVVMKLYHCNFLDECLNYFFIFFNQDVVHNDNALMRYIKIKSTTSLFDTCSKVCVMMRLEKLQNNKLYFCHFSFSF